MSERPILLTGAMVRAILDGTKSSTRRVVKVQADHISAMSYGAEPFGAPMSRGFIPPDVFILTYDSGKAGIFTPPYIRCPHGAPGDRLWVRETWHPALRFGTEYEIEYKADGASRMIDAGWGGPTPAIDAAIDAGWQVPSTMPRWASRITLQITAVRVERAHDDSPWVWVIDFMRVG